MSNKTIPENWTWEELGDCVDILDRHRDPINQTERQERLAEIDDNERIPYYGATGQVGWIDDYIFDEELVLLGEDGAPFLDPFEQTAYMIRGKSWVNNHAHVLRGKSGHLNNKFLLYYLNTVDYKPYITGTTRYKLNQTRMKEIQIPVAPIGEQELIVTKIEELFSKLDSGVSGLEESKERLEFYNRAVLKAAMEGKFTRETRQSISKTGSNSLEEILEYRRKKWDEEFQEVLKYSGKEYDEPESADPPKQAEIPKEWTWATVNQISYVVGGLTKNKSKREDYPTEVPYLRVANVYANELDLDEIKTIKISERENMTKMLKEGDLLIVEGNGSKSQIGRVALWDGSISPCSHQNHLIKVRILKESLRKFALYWLLSPIGRKAIVDVASSTSGLHTLSISKVRNIPIPIPPEEEAEKVVEEIERRTTVTDQVLKDVENEFVRTDRLRQSILKEAFEGNLTPQDPTEHPPNSDGEDANLEPRKQTTLSEVTSDVE